MSVKCFDYLPDEAKIIRQKVFVEEQGFIDEFDEADNESLHFLLFVDDKAVGTCRFLYSKEHECYAIGRFAVLKEYRNKHLGQELMKACEQEIIKKHGHIRVGLGAQLQAMLFYQKCGYNATETRYFEQDCPHVWMEKVL